MKLQGKKILWRKLTMSIIAENNRQQLDETLSNDHQIDILGGLSV
jgi:hypothetical protein